MVRIPTNRTPTHPGEMLRDEFLSPMNISASDLANAIHVPFQYINELISSQCSVTPSVALRLSKFFGMSPDFWLSMQVRWDLFMAQAIEKSDIDSIQDFHHLQKIA
jgi:addiction module HigA family antidote